MKPAIMPLEGLSYILLKRRLSTPTLVTSNETIFLRTILPILLTLPERWVVLGSVFLFSVKKPFLLCVP